MSPLLKPQTAANRDAPAIHLDEELHRDRQRFFGQ